MSMQQHRYSNADAAMPVQQLFRDRCVSFKYSSISQQLKGGANELQHRKVY
jgi:hypothetical protein